MMCRDLVRGDESLTPLRSAAARASHQRQLKMNECQARAWTCVQARRGSPEQAGATNLAELRFLFGTAQYSEQHPGKDVGETESVGGRAQSGVEWIRNAVDPPVLQAV